MGSEGCHSVNAQGVSGNFSLTLHIICKELDVTKEKAPSFHLPYVIYFGIPQT
jgi:hypothetical protein